MAKVQNAENSKCNNVDQQRFSFITDGTQKNTATTKYGLVVSYKDEHIVLPNNLAIVFLGIYLKELKTYVHRKSCT